MRHTKRLERAMLSTRFTKLVGCTIPIQLAGMGAVGSPELAAAVSEAGGLGMLGTARAGLNPTTLAPLLHRTRELTRGPFGVNFIIRPGGAPSQSRAHRCVEQAAKVGRVVEFFYSDPSAEFVRIVHEQGALASWQVGSADEARKAAAVGCDMIVAQGIEAGGHVRGTVGLMHLLCEVLDAVPEIPVLAAGGIGTGRAMAAALAAGAAGVRVGTRFVAAAEADVHPIYVDALIAARAEDSIYTCTFHVGWPEAQHRVLRSAIEAAEALQEDSIGSVVDIGGSHRTVPRFAATVADRTATGHVDAMALYAGQSVSAVTRIMPAREIVRELAEEAEEFLRRPIELHAAKTSGR
ncbi:NAD(P)H-dependent flavin oxidoreductase [Bradyrhizobium sp. DASA03076]|uniref:NAD(P)H-dependent flavin oxidoreductase n=1 Tax=Bradyrhizobium sp. BLXBL-03 TaxID=3395916 RepID=UPI003F6EAA42